MGAPASPDALRALAHELSAPLVMLAHLAQPMQAALAPWPAQLAQARTLAQRAQRLHHALRRALDPAAPAVSARAQRARLRRWRQSVDTLAALTQGLQQALTLPAQRRTPVPRWLAQWQPLWALMQGLLARHGRPCTPLPPALPLSPRALLHDLHALWAPRAQAQGLGWQVTVARRVPARLLGPAQAWRQWLINLLGNAFKFTPAGQVLLHADWRVPPGQARPALWLCVADSGVGMAPEEQARVWQLGYRARHSAAVPGHGLGLALLREALLAAGGQLQLESQRGHGTRVTLVLPAQRLTSGRSSQG
ncbi:MAG: hypothetical protein RIQ97_821 [Pseudomonadota bacterium]|jgi:signal transduction histidine kinase